MFFGRVLVLLKLGEPVFVGLASSPRVVTPLQGVRWGIHRPPHAVAQMSSEPGEILPAGCFMTVLVFVGFYRMFRGPQILTRSCPIRPLLETCAGRQGGRRRAWSHDAVQDSKRTPLSTKPASCSTQRSAFGLDCHDGQLREASFQNFIAKAILSSDYHYYYYYYPQVYDASNAKQSCDCWKCTVVGNAANKLKAVSFDQKSLINTTCPQPWRKLWDLSQPSRSLFNKTQCNFQSRPYWNQNFVRALSLSTRQARTSNHSQCSPQPCCIGVHQTRALHQAAPPDAWRHCLSPENESRCRQSLGPNFKLYESEKARTSVYPSQGKNRARRASVLVSLCSVEGEPALLFTLRSMKLKGRHKGDVR